MRERAQESPGEPRSSKSYKSEPTRFLIQKATTRSTFGARKPLPAFSANPRAKLVARGGSPGPRKSQEILMRFGEILMRSWCDFGSARAERDENGAPTLQPQGGDTSRLLQQNAPKTAINGASVVENNAFEGPF